MRKNLKRWMSGALAAAMVFTGIGWPGKAQNVEAAGPTLTVDMSKAGERELYHGATGWLYGQGDDQVPTANTITALKPNTAVQKAPNGMQHPNGDVLDIAETFLDAGGKHIQIYVPDYYALWFYEFTGTEYYLDILEMQAKACIEAGIEDDVVYVLYNEPTDQWIGGTYQDHDGNTVRGWDSMYWFWLDMVEKLREVYREAGVETEPKTAGLNLAVYDKTVMENYVKFCAEHDCMPDIVSWHDLATWQYNIFDQEYNHYRSMEEKYGVEPREIVINEYAAQSECASPGDLVRWIGLWEDYEVAGCLPFWHFSNNLNGLVADNNEGNGAWWLYKWYGDMSGSYLPVEVKGASQDDFYGAASIDENKKSANVIFGGRDGEAEIVLEDIASTDTFQGEELVHIKVEATDYTGFHGAAEEPRLVMEGALAVEDGTVTVPMSGMNEMSAYHITVTQATEDETEGMLTGTWKAVYEAEDGVLTGNAVVAEADGSYACSNRKKVHIVDNPGDSVSLQVSVPRDGYYKYDMVYCAATGVNTNDPANNTPYTAVQNLSVDGTLVEEMVLPSTLHWSMGGMYSTYLYLERGDHTLKIEATDSDGKAVPDCVYLTYRGKTEDSLLFDKTYEAELGEFNEIKGEATGLTTEKEGNVSYITGLEKRAVTEGGGVRFNVVVPENGMYDLSLSYQAEDDARANIYLDNDIVHLDRLRTTLSLPATQGQWKQEAQSLFLQKGINVVDIDTDGAVKLNSMRIRQEADSAPAAAVEAEEGTLTGEAAVGANEDVRQYASQGGYVSGLKAANGVELIPQGDPEFTILGLGRQVDLGKAVDANSLTVKVTVPEAGSYKMLVYQSSGELFGKHSYNAQMTERYASFQVNGQEPVKVVFRNTYSDETFRPQPVDVELRQGENTIKIYNDNSKVVTNGVLKPGQSEHRPENIDYSVLENYTPNLDKFEFYALTGESRAEDPEAVYTVSIQTTQGGTVDADKDQVKEGDSVRLTFLPEEGYQLVEARVNGRDIMGDLTALGGVCRISGVEENLEVNAYFAKVGAEEAVRETDYEYAVNAGDIDPTTLSEGDSFGLRNSVTDQFYGEDAGTGNQWGVLDTYKAESSYPGWLTGEKTWPCENDGATDASPKTKSFRYARNQDPKDVGVVYQFELEPGETYDLEMGFYVPSSWTSSAHPRTMKLVLNDVLCEEYKNFTASNDSNNPFIIRIPATADENGNLKVQIGHADGAAWGPVISYLSIYRQADDTKLTEAVEKYGAYQKEDYTEDSWTAFEEALKEAKDVLNQSGDLTNIAPINEALYRLEAAAAALWPYVDLTSLKEACDQYTEYIQNIGQGMTGDKEWEAFQDALANAQYLLSQEQITKEIAAQALTKLEEAAGQLSAVESLSVVKGPDKTVYYTGESLDVTGLQVEAVDQKGNKKTLEEGTYTLGEFDSSTVGEKEITVSFQGVTTSFTVEVIQRPSPVVLKEIKASASKTTYDVDEQLDRSTLKVMAVYSDGSEKEVSGYQVSGFDSSKAGSIQITVSWEGKSTQLTLTIQQKAGEPEAQKLSPTKVQVKASAYRMIQLKWNKVEGASGYEIYRASSKNGTYQKIKTINNGNTLTFKNKKLKFNKKYYYKVRAFRKSETGTEYSELSNTLTAKTRLAKPTLKLKRKASSGMNISWKKVEGASGYQIRYSLKKKSGYQSILIKKAKAGTYRKSGLKPNKKYYVKMRAYRTVKGKKVYGAWSTVKSIKIK